MTTPSVSIVIPTRDRPDRLAETVAAVAALEWEGAVELIVVDDGGIEPLASTLGGVDAEVLRAGGDGPAAARNLGAAAASGELLAFLDDDCAPEPGWLRALAAAAGGAVAAGGRAVNALVANPYSAASQVIDDAVHDHFAGGDGSAEFISSSNVLLDRDRFERAGGYDERFPVPGGEDRDFCMRWLESGGELRLVPGARVRHSHELTLGGFLRQHHSYGRGALLARRARKARGRGFEARPSLTSGVFTDALRRTRGRRSLAPLIVAWQAATATGIARELLRPQHRGRG